MKFINVIFVMLMVLVVAPLYASSDNETVQGNEVRNGGGGIEHNGQYMTFYKAQIPVAPMALERREIPGLYELLQVIQRLHVSDEQRASLFLGVYPTSDRQYYNVDKESLSEENHALILGQYAKLYKISDEKKITLFAVTAPFSRTTLLFPEFYKLTLEEQEAILLHESIWAINPHLTYGQVVKIETDFQKFLRDPNNADIYFQFYLGLSAVFGAKQGSGKNPNPSVYLRAAFLFDQNQIDSTKNYKISAKDLLGESFLTCVYQQYLTEDTVSHRWASPCLSKISQELLRRVSTGSSVRLSDQALLEYLMQSRPTSFYFQSRSVPSSEMDNIYFEWRNQDGRGLTLNLFKKDGTQIGKLELVSASDEGSLR